MEEDKGYEVIDKRNKPGDEETGPKEDTETKKEAAEAGAGEETKEQASQAGAPVGDVYSLISLSVMMLAESAWAWMGIRVNPATGKVEKDMTQAKIAIDSIVFLTDKIAPHISEEDRRALRSMISDLQINFVQQAGK